MGKNGLSEGAAPDEAAPTSGDVTAIDEALLDYAPGRVLGAAELASVKV